MAEPGARPAREVVLADRHDASGVLHVTARLTGTGQLRIEGQDLGAAVEGAFGAREYEWEIDVDPEDVEVLAAALGARGPDEVLDALAARFPDGLGIKRFLDDHRIVHGFWSRIGE